MDTYGPTVAGQLHHRPYTVDTVATEYFRAHQQFIRAHRALDYRFALRCQPVHQVIAHDTAYAAQGQRWSDPALVQTQKEIAHGAFDRSIMDIQQQPLSIGRILPFTACQHLLETVQMLDPSEQRLMPQAGGAGKEAHPFGGIDSRIIRQAGQLQDAGRLDLRRYGIAPPGRPAGDGELQQPTLQFGGGSFEFIAQLRQIHRQRQRRRAEGQASQMLLQQPGAALFETIRVEQGRAGLLEQHLRRDRKSTRLNSSHVRISYAVFCLKKKKKKTLAPFESSLPSYMLISILCEPFSSCWRSRCRALFTLSSCLQRFNRAVALSFVCSTT